MNQKEINIAYKKFNLPEVLMPNYNTPQDFALGFKKCSILKDSNIICYSNTTGRISNYEGKK